MNLTLQNATVKGVIEDAYVKLDGSRWFATGESHVCLVGAVEVSQMDAAQGVTIYAVAGEGCNLEGEFALTSGGKLVVKRL